MEPLIITTIYLFQFILLITNNEMIYKPIIKQIFIGKLQLVYVYKPLQLLIDSL